MVLKVPKKVHFLQFCAEPPFILAIKIAKKTVKILISDQVAFAAVVYFGPGFGFYRLINKGALKSFLLIMCK